MAALQEHELDIVPDPRWQLSEHLDSVREQQEARQDVIKQHDRLQVIIRAEAEAQARVDALKARDIQELAAQLENPTGLHVLVDHCDQAEAEWDAARAKREADVARACMPAVTARLTQADEAAALLEGRTDALVARVMLDEAAALAAEIARGVQHLRAKYARLYGLRRFMGETPALQKRAVDLSLPVHPDHVAPGPRDLLEAADAWRRYARTLSADPEAQFKE